MGAIVSIEQDEILHLTKVFRAQKGAEFQLTDGCGRLLKAKLVDFDKRTNQIEILETLKTDAQPEGFHIKIGFLKGRDLEEVVDTCSQWNPSSIQAIWTEHTQESPSHDHTKLLQRLETKSIVALKQSKSLWLTKILQPQSLEIIIQDLKISSREFPIPTQIVLDLNGQAALPKEILNIVGSQGANLWFGPEGGLSHDEIQSILGLPHSLSLKLGDKRLRAITAPIFTLGYLEGLLAAQI